MSDLKPCPFCGSDHLVYNSASGLSTGRFVRCADCHACGPLAEDDARAKAVWNEAPRRNEVVELPKDADGEPIRPGDVLFHKKFPTCSFEVTRIERKKDGSWIVLARSDGNPPDPINCDAFSHVRHDSLESIEEDIYHLVMSEYLDDPEADVKTIMERIKKLMKEGE